MGLRNRTAPDHDAAVLFFGKVLSFFVKTLLHPSTRILPIGTALILRITQPVRHNSVDRLLPSPVVHIMMVFALHTSIRVYSLSICYHGLREFTLSFMDDVER